MAIYKGNNLIAGNALPTQTGQSGKFLTTNGTTPSWADVQATPDNATISLNSDDELQTIGVINNRDSATPIKTWTGTRAQYNAITTKDSNTLYNITDDDISTIYDVYTKSQTDALLDEKEDALGYTPVNKAGDTMTGNLIIAQDGISQYRIKNTSFDSTSTTSPSAWTGIGGYYVADKSNNLTTYIENSQSTDGTITLGIGVRRKISGTNKDAVLNMSVDSSGKATYYPVQLITTYVNGLSGYNIWSNGYCEQWGRSTITANGIGNTFTLLKTYSDTNWNIVAVKGQGDTDGVGLNVQVASANTFQAGVAYGSALSRTLYWRANGYLASGQY